jgi:hypothetical protein
MNAWYRKITIILALTALLSTAVPGGAYPLDGYDATGIGRLEVARRIQAGELEGRRLPSGGLRGMADIDLRLINHRDFRMPAPDPAFTSAVVQLLGDRAEDYQVVVLDISDPATPRLAAHHPDTKQNVGSVGKLLVSLAQFQALADLYPDDISARMNLLRKTRVTADEFVRTDHHDVVLWDPATETMQRRELEVGDVGTLWEYLDWMMSASSNAAASTVIKQTMLMRHFGHQYPVDTATEAALFKGPRAVLGKLLVETLQSPVPQNGLDLETFRQGSFFTATGNRIVPATTSYATPRALIDYLLKMEQGLLVDEFSSREIKRLMYSTEKRIRYASSPALTRWVVYFKSGSLYQCKPEPGFRCLKYHGNVKNLMNSVAIVESPDGKVHYMVALLSNVLRRNSAVDHQTLATGIHELITLGKVSQATVLARTEEELGRAAAQATTEE